MGAKPLGIRLDGIIDQVIAEYESGISLSDLATKYATSKRTLGAFLVGRGVRLRTTTEQNRIKYSLDEKGMRLCHKCQAKFMPEIGRHGKLETQCSPCTRATEADYFQRNKKRIMEGNRARLDANDGELRKAVSVSVAAKRKKWRLENPEEYQAWLDATRNTRNAAARRNYERNREDRLEYKRAWAKSNPEVGRMAVRRRRARIRQAEGTYSLDQLRQRYAYYGFKCWMCGQSPSALQADHVKALCNGGSNWIANIRPACGDCNFDKGRREHYKVFTVRELHEMRASNV